MTSENVREELASVLAQLDRIGRASFDVADLEPTLVRLREYLRAVGPKSEAETFLVNIVNEWSVDSGDGVVEALEFTMHDLRWEGVRAALVRASETAADFRVRDQARRALEAYEDDWPGGEIYSTYRSAETTVVRKPWRWRLRLAVNRSLRRGDGFCWWCGARWDGRHCKTCGLRHIGSGHVKATGVARRDHRGLDNPR